MGGVARVSAVRTSAFTRVIWGATLLGAPRLVLRALGGRQTAPAVTTLRVLGARHVVQATATVLHPSRVVLAGGAGMDGLHALSALALAAVDPSQSRIAFTDASIAATWIGMDLRAALRPHARTRSRPWRMRGHKRRSPDGTLRPIIRGISARVARRFQPRARWTWDGASRAVAR